MKPEAMTEKQVWDEYSKLNSSTSSIKPIIFARAIEAETTRRWEAYVEERVREEREACAAICDNKAEFQRYMEEAEALRRCAAAIRARGEGGEG